MFNVAIYLFGWFVYTGIPMVDNHPFLATWIFNNIATVLISSLPAPSKTSSVQYLYWFKVLNTITGNLKRAQSTALENSPNWQAAVDNHLEKLSSGELQPTSALEAVVQNPNVEINATIVAVKKENS
jgi:hypothetical protein